MALSKFAHYVHMPALQNIHLSADSISDFLCSRKGILCIGAGIAVVHILKRLIYGSPGKVRDSWNTHYDFIIGKFVCLFPRLSKLA